MTNYRVLPGRKTLTALSVAALSLGLVGVSAIPAWSSTPQPTIVLDYSSKAACNAEVEYLVETHHRIFQGCTVDGYNGTKPSRWRLMAFPVTR